MSLQVEIFLFQMEPLLKYLALNQVAHDESHFYPPKFQHTSIVNFAHSMNIWPTL